MQDKLKIIFPIHPRTKKNLLKFKLIHDIKTDNLIINEPVGYLEFLNLMINSKLVLTDSGGIQEEASYLKIPVLTLRSNTERPITIEKGTNNIVQRDLLKIEKYLDILLENNYKKGQDIENWDGLTAMRIINIIKEKLNYESINVS